MRIARVGLRRVDIPFKRRFDHAIAARDSAERIYVSIESDRGETGLGEIMPRPYLTGETLDEVFSDAAPARAVTLIGQSFEDQASLIDYLKVSLRDAGQKLALAAGFEAALINLAEQEFGGFDYGAVLGPRRASQIGRCVTIGLVDDEKTLRRYALEAKMAKATVVKAKISNECDVERIGLLKRFLGSMPLRLDANGGLSFESAGTVLAGLSRAKAAPDSIEQPLDAAEPDLAGKLMALFEEHGVPIMADESVCSAADVEAWGEGGGYQIVNVRVGKCGGLIGAQAAIEAARRHKLGIVGGTLVGESGILDRNGGILLMRNDDMPYMEGLGQPRWLLEDDPTSDPSVNGHDRNYENRSRFRLNINQLKRWQVGEVALFS